jgi:1,4-dihydroxy-2-naphthoate octaprenyltransferase
MGLGDLSVLLFFGLVGVLGSYYLYTQQFISAYLLPAYSCGVFAVAVLNVNNIRDIESDRKAGKYSIPVRIGREKAVRYHWFLLVSGMAASVVFVLLNYQDVWQWLFVVSFPVIIRNGIAVKNARTSAALDPYLKQMALSTLLFVLTFGAGIILSNS